MSRELKEVVEEDRKLKNILEFTNILSQDATSFSHLPSHFHSSSTLPSEPTPPSPNLTTPPMAFTRLKP